MRLTMPLLSLPVHRMYRIVWVAQLRIGGRMILPIGDEKTQMLTLVRRIDQEHYEGHNLGEFRFVPLVGKEGWQEKK
jgi:protein-L-isoaspartate(D-aspartate) O-methyltransferase